MTQKAALRAFATALILVTIIGCSSQPQSSELQSIEDFTIEKLNEYRGKVVLLNFWAIWCKACRTEMPDLETAYQEYRDQGVVVLGVNVSESSGDITDYAQELGLTFPLLRDSEQKAMKTYNVKVLPTTFFIDQQGQLRHRQPGAMSKSFIIQRIGSLLD